MKKILKENLSVILIAVMAAFVLLVLIAPHIWLGIYNFPSGDDFDFGTNTYHAVQTGNVFTVLKCIFWDNPIDWSIKWEPRWAGAMLNGMNPAIWGIRMYGFCTVISFLAIIASQIYFVDSLFAGAKTAKVYALIISVITLILEVLYVPNPTMTFYWWTGIAAYTLPFCLCLFELGCVCKTMKKDTKPHVMKMIGFMLLSFFLGGNNFSVSILFFSALTALVIGRIIYDCKVLKDKKIMKRDIVLYVLLLLAFLLGLLLVFLSPALKVQLSSRYSGEVKSGFFGAIWNAVVLTLKNLCAFCDLKNVIFCFLIAPFAYMLTGKTSYRFYHPWFVTPVSILLLASQISVNMLVDGTIGGDYSKDIWFYATYLLVVCNEIYWIGYLRQKEFVRKLAAKIPAGKKQLAILAYTGVFAVLIAFGIYRKDFRTVSSYQAYNCVNNGFAQQYAKQWEERIAVLENQDIEEPKFTKITAYGGYLQLYDIYPQGDVAYWINEAMARYYGKISVDLEEQ